MKKAVLFLLVVFLVISRDTNAQTIGEQAPDFSVELLGGGEFNLSDNSGKVVLIFFFGNGCPFCISSGPKVQELYESYMNNDEFVAVGLDTWNSSSSESSVTNFQANSGVMFPLALSSGSVSTAYSTTYDRLAVIDKSGFLRHKGGSAAGNDVENASTIIAEYLSKTTAIENISGDENISIYPNPASDELFVKFAALYGNTFKISIYDVTGRERKSDILDSADLGSHSINTGDLEIGIYLYKIESGKFQKSGRLIIR
jgi:peroxiredoxin